MTAQTRTGQGTFEWTQLDHRAVDVARALAADAAETAGHGHPGTAMSLAPAAYLLFQRLLRHDLADPKWAGRARGGYVLAEAGAGTPEVILIATGSEVPIALRAREILEREGTPTRVVSMPCVEWFEEQDAEYRAAVLPRSVRARVSVEAGSSLGWYAMVGEAGESVGLDRFGLSAPYRSLYEQFGFTPERVAAHARSSLAKSRDRDRDGF